ncbi:MAG: long-chain fatty acid--CoA ligase [Bacteroidetes bacterium]|nr:long-chain fatty acid--CoA ligase [Bacteroidota bacterium]
MKNTLTSFLLDHILRTGLDNVSFYTKEDDEYIPFSNRLLIKQISSLITYFRKLNLKPGDKVAIISENRNEWVVTDFACMFYGLVSVPVYTSLSTSQIKYIIENSESKVCFLSNLHLLDKVSRIREELSTLKEIIIFQDTDTSKFEGGKVSHFTEIINPETNLREEDILNQLTEFSSGIVSSDLVTIVYTSGTTGNPKGVMLTHNNYCTNITACQKVLSINNEDIFLSYLPYSHSYERMAGYYLALFCGAKIYYAQSFETIPAQLAEVKPTFVITVPRLLDKFYNRIIKTGSDMDEGIRKKIFRWAVDSAHKKSFSRSSIKWKIADALVYKKIREKTGGNIRYFVSGGGALNKETGEFFEFTGITVLEGYGMTETSPVISVNPPTKNKYGTVGIPIFGVSVKLSDDNEILVSGDLVMKGYYKDKKSTDETIKDGWLHTGDIGEIDPEGYIRITDRKKSLIKTSGGKYIAPAHIEDLISGLSYIENVVIIGNERLYVTALIVPDRDQLTELAQKNNIEYHLYSDILKNKKICEIIKNDIDRLQSDLAPYERIRKFSLLEIHFTIEGGELTPTMKVKRKFIEERFRDEIEQMYPKI